MDGHPDVILQDILVHLEVSLLLNEAGEVQAPEAATPALSMMLPPPYVDAGTLLLRCCCTNTALNILLHQLLVSFFFCR